MRIRETTNYKFREGSFQTLLPPTGVRAMDAGGRSSPRPGLDDSFGSATNDPDMGHGLLQREMSRLEEEVASLKTKLRNAQDQILALEKVRSKLSALVPELV